jgi:ribonuclease HI
MKEYILVFDGGSKGKPFRPVRIKFGHGTNNEAEYKALIAGLHALIDKVESENIDPAACLVEVRGDSQLVLNQLSGTWKVKNLRMRTLWDQAQELLSRFREQRLRHQSRNRTVEILGH